MMGWMDIERAKHDGRLEQAIGLFEFLTQAQALRNTPVRLIETYRRDGEVIWLAEIPRHSAVDVATDEEEPPAEAALMTLRRVPPVEPPEVTDELALWIDAGLDDPGREPALSDEICLVDGTTEVLTERQDIVEVFDNWIGMWRRWAEVELVARPVRKAYLDLFSMYIKVGAQSEQFELVVAVGCLAWQNPDGGQVLRHMLVRPATIEFDEESGELSVIAETSLDGISVELDMMDPQRLRDADRINAVKSEAREYVASPLNRVEAGRLARRLVHTLDPNGRYEDALERPGPSHDAFCTFAPALILRKRSQQGLVQIYRTIVDQLREAGVVPDGILPLVDPDHLPTSSHDSTPGAMIQIDNELFLPLPVNDRQLDVIRSVDANAQTVVQGPPGTGKTHTAAALISHLLAQGKRVLVTAQTDRALREVRAKLPAEIQPLSVSVVGASRDDMASLKVAVESIADRATEFDLRASQQEIETALSRIDELKRERARVHRQLIDARELETTPQAHGSYSGTLARIAERYALERERYTWLDELESVGADTAAPLSSAEAKQWLALLRDHGLAEDEWEASMRLVDISALVPPDVFARLCDAERLAKQKLQNHDDASAHAVFPAVRALPAGDRLELQRRMTDLGREARDLENLRDSWVPGALADVRLGRAEIWRSRATQVSGLIGHAQPLVQQLGPLLSVEIPAEDRDRVLTLMTTLRDHLATGGQLKVNADGSPKVGAFASKIVKQCAVVFATVRVNGRPPVTIDQLNTALTYAEADRTLISLNQAWPISTLIPDEDTLAERLAWHQTESQRLAVLLSFSARIADTERYLTAFRLPKPDWNEMRDIVRYAELVDAAVADDELAAASGPLSQLTERVGEAAQWAGSATSIDNLLTAVRTRDRDRYFATFRRLERLAEVAELLSQREDLGARVSASAPSLYAAVDQSRQESRWLERLADFEAAWDWASTGTWVRQQEVVDSNSLQAKINVVESQLRGQVERLAAARAWRHAVAPARLTGQAKADLHLYAQLVRKLGKGTGKYAEQQRGDIRRAIDRCRVAVPVWIMPIYRIAEQLRVTANMFDVVIVDEASQAGLEATFLQYLAPKIVVIGDDKQVSPSAVGIDRQQLRDLGENYIANDRYKASWIDPTQSFFDGAVMRYGSRITLVEHRRCVPEIIAFSNMIAYEPDGKRLIPVRQYGSDRLEPIKVIHTADGYEKGTTSKVNPVEVEAIVDQIEKCLADPRYDGKSFGVISLLGTAQARAVERALLEKLAPEEWTARDLRCGDAADFQGSERDVIFLSMVASVEPGRRLGALTTDQYLQRYNVAVSRGKDQLWLVHTVQARDTTNPDDMRRKLLDYCYAVAARFANVEPGVVAELVAEDARDMRFDSLFEQRVFNRILGHGYTAMPQYPANGYRIDIVVLGGSGKLAVECDGDAWHGPDQYEHDMARERDLARCGWRFHRIRESAFYLDPEETMDALWVTLEQAGIHPAQLTDDLAEHVVDVATAGLVATTLAPEVDVPEVVIKDQVPAPIIEADAEQFSPAPLVRVREVGSVPRFVDGKMRLTVAARERVWLEHSLISQWLFSKQDPDAVDRLANRAQRDALRRKRSEYEVRQRHLDTVLAESFADVNHQGGQWVTPGSLIDLQFDDHPQVEQHIISVVPLGGATSSISPFSPLGRQLEGAGPGDILVYEAPKGTATARIVEIRD
jgi:transcription elongation GreA/GreB family factor/very-short-patch-repair endonuclease